MTFTHRPSYPDDPRSHAKYRKVIYDGVVVGAVAEEETAHYGTYWGWSAIVGEFKSEIGESPTMEEALAETKRVAQETIEQRPEVLELHRQRQAGLRKTHNAWRELHGKPLREY